MAFTILITFQYFMEAVSLNETNIGGIFRKITECTLVARSGNFRFLDTSFSRKKYFVIVRYSATNNDLPCNNRFRFQGNVFRVSRVWESMFNVFAPILSSCSNYKRPGLLQCVYSTCSAALAPFRMWDQDYFRVLAPFKNWLIYRRFNDTFQLLHYFH
jgi:hypothetical protein